MDISGEVKVGIESAQERAMTSNAPHRDLPSIHDDVATTRILSPGSSTAPTTGYILWPTSHNIAFNDCTDMEYTWRFLDLSRMLT